MLSGYDSNTALRVRCDCKRKIINIRERWTFIKENTGLLETLPFGRGKVIQGKNWGQSCSQFFHLCGFSSNVQEPEKAVTNVQEKETQVTPN